MISDYHGATLVGLMSCSLRKIPPTPQGNPRTLREETVMLWDNLQIRTPKVYMVYYYPLKPIPEMLTQKKGTQHRGSVVYWEDC